MTRYLRTAVNGGRRLGDIGRRIGRDVRCVISTLSELVWLICATLCAATMLAVFVIVLVVGAGMTVTAWRDTGVEFDAAAVIVLGILAALAILPVRAYLRHREERHYDMQRPWLPSVEQAQADMRLRQQVARYAEQKRRTANNTGEHAAVRFP